MERCVSVRVTYALVAMACLAPVAPARAQINYSAVPEANAAMARGTAAAERGAHADAIAEFAKALAADETVYEAAVRTAAAYAKLRATDSAYAWYGRATRMHPDGGSAWRGWSDLLRRNGRSAESLEKAIEAIVAEPYSRESKDALVAWSAATKTPLGQPAVNLPVRNRPAVRTAAMVAYDSVRKAWKGEAAGMTLRYLMEFPRASAYRHTMAEELEALRAAYRAGGASAGTRNLKVLDDDGILEAYVLFARVNESIALDYAEYRLANRDRLRKFWSKYVVGWKYR